MARRSRPTPWAAISTSSDGQVSTWTRLTDPAGQPYRFTYDGWGNPIAAEDPLANQVTLGYDYRFNRLALLQDARLRAYPNNPDARKAIKAQAKCRKAA